MIKLSLTYESTTLDFQAAGCVVLDGFYPVTATSEENVVETFDILIIGSSTELINWVRSINQAFDYARRRYDDNYPVYLNFALNQTLDAWRTRIVDGAILFNSKLDPNFRSGRLKATITIEHLAWWEGPEAQIPLTNANGTNNTSGLTVKNCGDLTGTAPTKRDNTVNVAAASVIGDLPAATRLEITNTYNDPSDAGHFLLGHNVYSSPGSFAHILEGEDAATGTVLTNASYSGGEAMEFDWNDTAEALAYSWTLPTSLLNTLRGSYIRVLAKFSPAPSDSLWVRLRIKVSVTTLWDGSQVLLSSGGEVQELATLRLPPYLLKTGNLFPLTLQMTVMNTFTGAHWTVLDFLQITPVDSWRKLYSAGYYLPYLVKLVDDGIDGLIFTEDGTSGKLGNYIGYNNPIKLIPGADQKIYFLWESASGTTWNDRTASVKLYYRPRRRNI